MRMGRKKKKENIFLSPHYDGNASDSASQREKVRAAAAKALRSCCDAKEGVKVSTPRTYTPRYAAGAGTEADEGSLSSSSKTERRRQCMRIKAKGRQHVEGESKETKMKEIKVSLYTGSAKAREKGKISSCTLKARSLPN